MAMAAGKELRSETTHSRIINALKDEFPRVGLFRLDGTRAIVGGVHGISDTVLGQEISLIDRTPLRSAIEAASPVVGSGRESGGLALTQALGVAPARTYVVLPIVENGRITALVYADRIDRSIDLASTAELFNFCSRLLNPSSIPRPRVQSSRRRRGLVLGPRRPRKPSEKRRPTTIPLPIPEILDLVDEELTFETAASDTVDPARSTSGEDFWPTVEPALTHEPVLGPSPHLPPQPALELPLTPPLSPSSHHHPTVVITPNGAYEKASSRSRAKGRPGGRSPRGRVALALTIGLIAGFVFLLSPPRDRGKTAVRIPDGAPVREIARRLADAGVIRNALAFRVMSRLSGTDRHLKSGTYTLPLNKFTWEITSELLRGQVNLVQVTFPEGLLLEEAAAIIGASGLTTERAFLNAARDRELLQRLGVFANSAEGYLFPETYRIAQGVSAEEIVSVLVGHFHEVRAAIPAAADLEGEALHRWVTLSSIVQREVKNTIEMERVAGVFVNRLKRGMRLESCATVQYILGKPKARLTLNDIRIQHPYNTYLNEGLPPGPIGSPGRAALSASAHPAEHGFLFFVAKEDGTGTHAFSKTFAEHEKFIETLGR